MKKMTNIIVGCGGSGAKIAVGMAELMGQDPSWRHEMDENVYFMLLDTDRGDLDAHAAKLRAAAPNIHVASLLTTNGYQTVGEILDDEGDVFLREWLTEHPTAGARIVPAPLDGPRIIRARFVDFAASEPSDVYPDPDYTVASIVALDPTNREYRIEDVRRVRFSPGRRDDWLEEIAHDDSARYGRTFRWYLEQEPGSGGKTQVEELVRVLDGVVVAAGMSPVGDKTERADPASSAAEQGRLTLVRATWNDAVLDELVGFRRDGSHAHDDVVDTVSMAFAKLPELSGRRRRGSAAPVGDRKDSAAGPGGAR